ncbi:Heavy-chain fibroin [Candidatus Burkholderia humilis]|nr:Heavy-chain fibroin [Candidatus Burkholderia humilis]
MPLQGTHNNGVTLAFPALAAGGTQTVSGTLTFGMDTQANNASGSDTKLVISGPATVKASYGDRSLQAILDTGSGAYYFPDSTIAMCPASFSSQAYYCPSQKLTRTATLQGKSGNAQAIQFDILNASVELANNLPAHGGIGVNVDLFEAGVLDLGMPFFYGRTVTFGIQRDDGEPAYFAFRS